MAIRQRFAEIRPVLGCFADTIVHCGDVARGPLRRSSVVNNMLSLGYTARNHPKPLATAKKSGVDLTALRQIVTAGGANSVMFQRLAAYQIDGDNTQLQFVIANAQKRCPLFPADGRGLADRRLYRLCRASTTLHVEQGGDGAERYALRSSTC